MKKSANDLIPSDFEEHPIWEPTDDFEDEALEVAPFPGDVLPLEGTFLIAATIKTASGATYQGYVNFSDGVVTTLYVAVSGTGFVGYALGRDVEDEESRQELSAATRMRSEDLFPLEYMTRASVFIKGGVA
jgi:hypothetical protein